MYTTVNETGQLNNYATEPNMYLASYPAPEQQRRYLLQGGLRHITHQRTDADCASR